MDDKIRKFTNFTAIIRMYSIISNIFLLVIIFLRSVESYIIIKNPIVLWIVFIINIVFSIFLEFIISKLRNKEISRIYQDISEEDRTKALNYLEKIEMIDFYVYKYLKSSKYKKLKKILIKELTNISNGIRVFYQDIDIIKDAYKELNYQDRSLKNSNKEFNNFLMETSYLLNQNITRI